MRHAGYRYIFFLLVLSFLVLPVCCLSEQRLDPAFPVPEYITHLLDIASAEVGYTEGDHGYSKYGEWSGDPYAQWCAEFLCWCVDQVDKQYDTALLNNVYPLYSGSNSGRNWFIKEGRYIIRTGPVDGWGYQWLKGEDSFISTGSYIPQPGDWIFFTWTATTDTDHVAMVEYCTIDDNGEVTIHVIEGNNPSSVARNTYPLTWSRILGYGTVHDAADITMRFGNEGKKVEALQEKLIYTGYLDEKYLTGHFGNATAEAIRQLQTEYNITPNGIANITTQKKLDEVYEYAFYHNPETWLVIDDDDDDDDW